jgi:hypothetical protein
MRISPFLAGLVIATTLCVTERRQDAGPYATRWAGDNKAAAAGATALRCHDGPFRVLGTPVLTEEPAPQGSRSASGPC